MKFSLQHIVWPCHYTWYLIGVDSFDECSVSKLQGFTNGPHKHDPLRKKKSNGNKSHDTHGQQSKNWPCFVTCDTAPLKRKIDNHATAIRIGGLCHAITNAISFRQLLVDIHFPRCDNFVCWHIHQVQIESHHYGKFDAKNYHSNAVVRAPNQRMFYTLHG